MLEKVKRLLDQIGGPNSLSIWSFVATIPIAILVSSTYKGTPTWSEVLVWQSIVLGVHVILGVLMFIALKTILRGNGRKPRPFVAIAFFVFLGTIRGLALDFAQNTVGIAGAIFQERMAVNILGSIVALSVVAIVVDDFRHDREIVQRLEKARSVLTNLRASKESILEEADVKVLERVRTEIQNALEHDSSNPERVRAISEDIARRFSHELYAQSKFPNPIQETNMIAKLTLREAFSLMRAPSPLAVALIVEMTIFPAVAARFGILVALENAVFGGLLIYLGCWIISKINLDSLQTPIRLVLLISILASTGGLAAAICALFVPELNAIFPERIIGIATGVSGIGIALSLSEAIKEGRILRQRSLSQALSSERKLVDAIGKEFESRRLKAASFLHGKIQSELIAKSVTGEQTEEIVRVINRLFSEYSITPTSNFHERFHNLIRAWSAVLEIKLQIHEDVNQVLLHNHERCELLLDVFSEALTNVIRHSSGKEALVSIFMSDKDISIKVTSDGALSEKSVAGIGLKQLSDRGVEVIIESSNMQTTLSARV